MRVAKACAFLEIIMCHLCDLRENFADPQFFIHLYTLKRYITKSGCDYIMTYCQAIWLKFSEPNA